MENTTEIINSLDDEILSSTNEVNSLQKQIDDTNTQIIIQNERMRQLKEQLKSEYGCDTEEELIAIKNNLLNDIQDLKNKLSENTEDVENTENI